MVHLAFLAACDADLAGGLLVVSLVGSVGSSSPSGRPLVEAELFSVAAIMAAFSDAEVAASFSTAGPVAAFSAAGTAELLDKGSFAWSVSCLSFRITFGPRIVL